MNFGVGDLRVDAFELLTYTTTVEAGGCLQGIKRPSEGIGNGEWMERWIIVGGCNGVIGNEATDSQRIGARTNGLVFVGFDLETDEVGGN